MNAEFIEALRKRTASASIGAATARKMGPVGKIAAARTYLAALRLADSNCERRADFDEQLDDATDAFARKIKYWGAARKVPKHISTKRRLQPLFVP